MAHPRYNVTSLLQRDQPILLGMPHATSPGRCLGPHAPGHGEIMTRPPEWSTYLCMIYVYIGIYRYIYIYYILTFVIFTIRNPAASCSDAGSAVLQHCALPPNFSRREPKPYEFQPQRGVACGILWNPVEISHPCPMKKNGENVNSTSKIPGHFRYVNLIKFRYLL